MCSRLPDDRRGPAVVLRQARRLLVAQGGTVRRDGELPRLPDDDATRQTASPDKDALRRDDLTRVHTMPVDDLIEHETDEGCVCGPEAEFVSGGILFSHHSLDGREDDE